MLVTTGSLISTRSPSRGVVVFEFLRVAKPPSAGGQGVDAYRGVFGAAVAAAFGGVIAAYFGAGVHEYSVRAGMMLSAAVSLTAGLYGVYGVLKRPAQPAPAVAATEEPARRNDIELKREPHPWAGKVANDVDASPMEIRMTGSLKSIRDQAEQGLFATDAEKARHLAAIWSMAACDLDDERDQATH